MSSARNGRRGWGRSMVLLFVLTSCSVPSFVRDRPDLDDCATGRVYMPVRQAPSAAEEASTMAIECFQTARDQGRSVELRFVLLGTEGQRYDALVQTLEAKRVNYFREHDDGWEGSLGCEVLTWPEPGIPEVSGCEEVVLPG